SDVSHYLYGGKIPEDSPDPAVRGSDSASPLYGVHYGDRRGASYDGGLVYSADVCYHRLHRRIYLYLYSGIHERVSCPSQRCAGQAALFLFHAVPVPGGDVRARALTEYDLDVFLLGDHKCYLVFDDRIHALG